MIKNFYRIKTKPSSVNNGNNASSVNSVMYENSVNDDRIYSINKMNFLLPVLTLKALYL